MRGVVQNEGGLNLKVKSIANRKTIETRKDGTHFWESLGCHCPSFCRPEGMLRCPLIERDRTGAIPSMELIFSGSHWEVLLRIVTSNKICLESAFQGLASWGSSYFPFAKHDQVGVPCSLPATPKMKSGYVFFFSSVVPPPTQSVLPPLIYIMYLAPTLVLV